MSVSSLLVLLLSASVGAEQPADATRSDARVAMARGDIEVPPADEDEAAAPAFTLQLLHVGDPENGASAIPDAPRFSAILAALQGAYPESTVTLSSGDNWLPGAFYTAGGDSSLDDVIGLTESGRPDIAMLNAMGFQASVFGNHEFDQGSGAVAGIIAPAAEDADEDGEPDASWAGAAFPYLSANLDFSTDDALAALVSEDGQDWASGAGQVARSTTITVGGERIGVVGATTPTLDAISSPSGLGVAPEDADDLTALAAIIQSAVDALTAEGIDKVILLAHMQQLAIERSLAPLLTGVDVIVAGGSNTILADSDDTLRAGDEAAGPYPIWLESASSEPVALVNTDGNLRYVGRLVVGFDAQGVLLPESVDPAESGAYATDAAGVAAFPGAEADATVSAIADAVGEVLVARDGNTFGWSEVYLDGARASVRTEETNLGNLSADAQLWYARQADPTCALALRNGGGIRDDIGEVTFPPGSTDPDEVLFLPSAANAPAGKAEGEISQFDIENTLRFNNGVTLLTVTAAELVTVFEHAFSGTAEGATPGRFPQVSGVRVSFDPALEPGARVRNLAIVDQATGAVLDAVVADGALQGDAERSIRMTTLAFLAGGGDGYPFPDPAAEATATRDLEAEGFEVESAHARFADGGTEQDALAEYLSATHASAESAFGAAERDPAEDTRIQNLSAVARDTVYPAAP